MKKNKPLVSIIMAEYNTDIKLLKESIKSILDQSYENLELILIDDCGKNDLKKIIDDFHDERIRLYKNEKNSGLVYSLNKAINLSKGKYIARMDTDDYSYKNRLKTQLDFLENNKEIDLVASNIEYYDGKKIWGSTNYYGKVKKSDMLGGCIIAHPTVMYKKTAIEKIGGYLDYQRCEDYATWIEFFVKGFQMYIMKEKLVRYHLSRDDYKKRTLKTRKGFFRLIKEQYIKLNPSKFQLLKIYAKTFIAGCLPSNIMFNYHKSKMKGRIDCK